MLNATLATSMKPAKLHQPADRCQQLPRRQADTHPCGCAENCVLHHRSAPHAGPRTGKTDQGARQACNHLPCIRARPSCHPACASIANRPKAAPGGDISWWEPVKEDDASSANPAVKITRARWLARVGHATPLPRQATARAGQAPVEPAAAQLWVLRKIPIPKRLSSKGMARTRRARQASTIGTSAAAQAFRHHVDQPRDLIELNSLLTSLLSRKSGHQTPPNDARS
jgi:hypothetical protein